MNDIREPAFSEERFAAELGWLLDGLNATGATVLTCTLPDIAAIMSLPADLVEVARWRMRRASDIIREQAASRGAVCLDAWAIPGAADPELFGPDRIHPNASGHQLMADAFAALLLTGWMRACQRGVHTCQRTSSGTAGRRWVTPVIYGVLGARARGGHRVRRHL